MEGGKIYLLAIDSSKIFCNSLQMLQVHPLLKIVHWKEMKIKISFILFFIQSLAKNKYKDDVKELPLSSVYWW